MPIYKDGSFAYGSLASIYPKPTLIDAPIGSRVKIRFHQQDITRAFILHANGDFSAWSVDWVDEKKRTLKLLHPIANTVRSNSI